MPKKIFTDAELKRIISKYVFSVHRDPATTPDIKNLVTEAMQKYAPDREIDDADVSSVISNLSRRSTISDKDIHEAAKEVIDHSAMEDLKFMVTRNIREIGRKPTAKDIEAIIRAGKLHPLHSTLAQIKTAVRSFYSGGKPLEHYTPTELRDEIRKELEKNGLSDERDIKAVLQKYLEVADQDRPINPDEIRDVIQAHLKAKAGKAGPIKPPPPIQPPPPLEPPSGPLPTEISRGRGKKETKHDIKQGAWVPPSDPKNPTFFDKIRLKLRRYGIKSLTRGSRNWLQDTVYEASRKPSRKRLVSEGQTAAEAIIGKMFLYFYDAKTKKQLPYWDKFPLIFVIELYDDGWLGINLHYLPLPLRAKLFDKLLQFANDKSLDKITKLKLSYALLKDFSRFPEVKPCIKRYLSSYVKSQLLPIEAINWEIALFLPVEQFQKESKEYVWAESRKKIRSLKRR